MQLNQRFNHRRVDSHEIKGSVRKCENQNSEFNFLSSKSYVQHYLRWWFNQVKKRATFVTHKTDFSHLSCAKLPPAQLSNSEASGADSFHSVAHTLTALQCSSGRGNGFLDSIKVVFSSTSQCCYFNHIFQHHTKKMCSIILTTQLTTNTWAFMLPSFLPQRVASWFESGLYRNGTLDWIFSASNCFTSLAHLKSHRDTSH